MLKNCLPFQQKVVRVSTFLTKGHQGARDLQSLATSDCSIQRSRGKRKRQPFIIFLHYITNFYKFKYLPFLLCLVRTLPTVALFNFQVLTLYSILKSIHAPRHTCVCVCLYVNLLILGTFI